MVVLLQKIESDGPALHPAITVRAGSDLMGPGGSLERVELAAL